METKEFLNKWVFCIHLYWKDEFQEINNLYLVEKEFQNFVKDNRMQTLYKCVAIENDYLVLQSKKFMLKVKKEGIKKILPQSTFQWEDMIQEIERPEIMGKIEDVIWHEKNSDFLYYITTIDGKKKSRQYKAHELKKLA